MKIKWQLQKFVHSNLRIFKAFITKFEAWELHMEVVTQKMLCIWFTIENLMIWINLKIFCMYSHKSLFGK